MTDERRQELMHAHMRLLDEADNLDAQGLTEAAASLREQADDVYDMATYTAPTHEADDEAGDGTDAVDGDVLHAVFDNRDVPDSDRKRKWTVRGGRIKRTNKTGLGVHHTAVVKRKDGKLVSEGFGASSALVRKYEARIANGDRTAMVPGMAGFGAEHPDITPGQWARAYALAHRFKDQSYHAITAKNSVLYINQEFDRRTWHGDGMNDQALGWAYDSDLRYGSFDRDEVYMDLLTVKDAAANDGHDLVNLWFHCQWTNKPHDPGPVMVQWMLDTVCPGLQMNADMDFKTNGGRSIREVLAAK